MRLRNSIRAPVRFEDEEQDTNRKGNGTKPAYPDLMRTSILPYNPNNPPAAFPSIPLTPMQDAANTEKLSDARETPNSCDDSLGSISSDGNSLSGHDLHMAHNDLKQKQDSSEQENQSRNVLVHDGPSGEVIGTTKPRESAALVSEMRLLKRTRN